MAPTPLATAVRSSAYRAAVANNFAVGWAIFGVRSSLIPLFVVEGLHLSAAWTGVGLVLSAVVQALVLIPAGRLVDTRGRRPFLRAGAAVVMAAGVVVAVAGGAPLFLVGMALYGTGSAFLGVSSAAVVGDVIGGRGGTPVAAFQMASDAGAFLGPLVAGAPRRRGVVRGGLPRDGRRLRARVRDDPGDARDPAACSRLP